MSVETKNCVACSQDFSVDQADFDFYQQMDVSAPTHCPDCRQQRRLAFRNERSYYKRTCDMCNENVISSYPAETPFPVYCHTCWWSDKWDAHEYGRDFDFNRPFFEQFQELYNVVPRIAIVNDNGVASKGCEYTYDLFFSKNCYLSVCAWELENVSYSFLMAYDKDCADCFNVYNSELCYECFRTDKSARCAYSSLCFDSTDCFLCYDIKGCNDCIMSTGLRNKQYYIKNEPHTKEEYEAKKKELNLGSRASLKKHLGEFEDIKLQHPRRFMSSVNCVDSTGDMISNCKNVKNTFFHRDFEDGKFLYIGEGGKNEYDQSMTGKAENAYECMVADMSYGSKFDTFCLKGTNVHYSDYCHSGNELLGCIGLKNSEYSIFNKKYSKEEYKELYDKIKKHMEQIGEWGEFFPMTLSPFAYNESAAYEYFPMTKEQATEKGLRWHDREPRDYTPDFTADAIPDTLPDDTAGLVGKVVACVNKGEANHGKCTTAFGLIESEVNLYAKLGLPLPDKCPNCRYYDRLEKINPFKLWHRQCMCELGNHDHDGACPNEFQTSYAPGRNEVVYCQGCYKSEFE